MEWCLEKYVKITFLERASYNFILNDNECKILVLQANTPMSMFLHSVLGSLTTEHNDVKYSYITHV